MVNFIFSLIHVALGLSIEMKKLKDNPGILPLKLGSAKIVKTNHVMFHYYDLSLIIDQMNKLHFKAINVTETIDHMKTTKLYLKELDNFVKIMEFIQGKVFMKISQIIPRPKRIKRGLINIMGSMFKAVTGNLDASDGERYDKEINNLQRNVDKEIKIQKSLATTMIKEFNLTIQNLNNNNKLIENKINEILPYVQAVGNEKTCIFLKEIVTEITNMYEIIYAMLQDIENSLVFARIGLMHPSVIRTEELFLELRELEENLGTNKLPISVTSENALMFEKLIDIECFILNNKIVYVMHIPVVHAQVFDYFHLYAVPIHEKDQFKVVIPQQKYLAITQEYYTYYASNCKIIKLGLYMCSNKELIDISSDTSCEVGLLSNQMTKATCRQTRVIIKDTVKNRLETLNQWILVIPRIRPVIMQCPGEGSETQNIEGTYLLKLPAGCQVTIDKQQIYMEVNNGEGKAQPIWFPRLSEEVGPIPTLNLSRQLSNLSLDEFHTWEREIKPTLEQFLELGEVISITPSLWTVLMYLIAIGGCSLTIWKIWILPKCQRKTSTQGEPIQLPQAIGS